MIFSTLLTEADYKRAEQVPSTEAMYASARFEGVRALHVFRQVYLKPVLDELKNPTERQEVLLHFHYRITSLVGSARRLNSRQNVQSISSCARSIFELGCDLAICAADQTDESAKRVLAFNKIEAFKSASVISQFYEGKPAPNDFSIATYTAVANDPNEKAAMAALKERHWPNVKKVNHWSKFTDARQRAHHAGGLWEERYVRHYARLSWYVHGGLVGILGMRFPAFDVLAAMAYALIEEVVLESFVILAKEFDLSGAITHWNERIAFLASVSSLTLADLRLQSLEPPRMVHIEPNEESI